MFWSTDSDYHMPCLKSLGYLVADTVMQERKIQEQNYNGNMEHTNIGNLCKMKVEMNQLYMGILGNWNKLELVISSQKITYAMKT